MATTEDIKNRIAAIAITSGDADFVNFTTIKSRLTGVSTEEFTTAILELMTEEGCQIIADSLRMGHLVGQLKAKVADEVPFAGNTVGLIRFF